MRRIGSMVMVVVLLFAASECHAAMMGAVRLSRGGGSLGGSPIGGGEFRLEVGSINSLGNVVPRNFLDDFSFCMEYSESISTGVWYKFAITDSAYFGSEGPSGDPIDTKSKQLYNHWNDNRTDADGANTVQTAIWQQENEAYGSNAYDAAATALRSTFDSGGVNENVSSANVRVMNIFSFDADDNDLLTFLDTGVLSSELQKRKMRKQDQMIRTVNGGVTIVPEPASLALFGLGMALMGTVRVRSRKVAC